jgi:hypothetical protein
LNISLSNLQERTESGLESSLKDDMREEPAHQLEANDQKVRIMMERSSITEKLCQQVMALFKWKKGMDTGITEDMVRALESWLQRRGVSIYTDFV